MTELGRRLRDDERGVSPVMGGLVIVVATLIVGIVAAQSFLKFSEPLPDAQVTGMAASVRETLRTNLTDSDLILMPIAGETILLRESKLLLVRDGVSETIDLTAGANSTRDGALWRAGEEMCIVGTSAHCLRAAADTVEVTLTTGNQLLYRGTHHLRAFTILPTGGVQTACDGPALVRVVGSDITYGATGPQIPVRLNYTANNGTTIQPLFGLKPIVAGWEWSGHERAGSVIGLRGSAKYANFNAVYSSWIGNAHVAVLKDADPAPNVPAFGNQTSVETFLQPYVDTQTRAMRLSYNEVILLFEFNPSLTSPAADWQDAVALVRFPEGGCTR